MCSCQYELRGTKYVSRAHRLERDIYVCNLVCQSLFDRRHTDFADAVVVCKAALWTENHCACKEEFVSRRVENWSLERESSSKGCIDRNPPHKRIRPKDGEKIWVKDLEEGWCTVGRVEELIEAILTECGILSKYSEG